MTRRILETSSALATMLLLAIAAALLVNVVAREVGVVVPAAAPLAPWALTALAFAALPTLAVPRTDRRGLAGAVLTGFALGTLGLGLGLAAQRIGGTDQGLGIPLGARFAVAAAFCVLALLAAAAAGWRAALVTLLGVALSLAPLPPLPLAAGAAAFAVALVLDLPVAIALVVGVAVAPGPLADAALAQSFVRGLSPYPLLAVPLFILSAALMVEGGIGERIVTAARVFARGRRSALGEANILASLLFGGVSGSSIADAALNARLLVPGMIAAGYRPSVAVGITAAGAVLPNVVPPSIALLLASSAVNQSIDALWLAGLGAGLVLTASLLIAVRLLPPRGIAPVAETLPDRGAALLGLAAPLMIGLGILGALRAGAVTAVEGGLVAVVLSALFVLPRGPGGLLRAAREAALQTGRVGFLIASASPIGALFALSGVRLEGWLPAEPALLALAATIAICLLVGTVLDVGAAILVMLPILVPPVVAAGADPIHVTVCLTVALLLGGLTPPVAILTVVVRDVTGIRGGTVGALPFLFALTCGLAVLAVVPALTTGLVALF